jgi:DNA-binding response OmpR family regulator
MGTRPACLALCQLCQAWLVTGPLRGPIARTNVAAMTVGDIFLVDDTPANLGLLATILRDAGHAVRVATSGRRALQAVRAQPPEMILLDITMPEMDGFELCAELKADAATRHIPIIFLSALDDVRDKVSAFRAGGVDYVTKPFQADEVVARVETQLKLARLRRELAERNDELARANEELARTNEELVSARSHAEQIFGALTDVLEGTVLDGRYRLQQKIGSGATAAVYRGHSLVDERPVAVKVLRPRSGKRAVDASRERRSLARVNHPNAVVVLDDGETPAGIGYLVMELLAGRTLADELAEQGRLSFERASQVLLPVARTLASAHAAGVVHRDVKPANIFLHNDGGVEIVKVLDFGIARIDDDTEGQDRRTGTAFVGTPIYMAPERLLGQPSDGRSDVYALGVTLYQALSGIDPFEQTGSLGALVNACLNESPVPLRRARPDVNEDLERIVMRSLARHPAERPTMADLAALLPFAFSAQLRSARRVADDETANGPLLSSKA